MYIDIESLSKLVSESDQIFISAEGEESLKKLLEIQEQVEKAITTAELLLEQAALTLNPNFSSITGDQIKVYYRAYGARYKIDESFLPHIPKQLYKTLTKYSVIPDEVDKWTLENKGMPVGIIEPERKKQLKFSLKNKKTDDLDVD
jgi:hypothetical protein